MEGEVDQALNENYSKLVKIRNGPIEEVPCDDPNCAECDLDGLICVHCGDGFYRKDIKC